MEQGITFDGVIGVSAGAIHGCSFVAGQVGRSIRYNLEYGNDYRFMSFWSWLLSGNLVNVKFCYHDLPEKLDPFDNEAFENSPTKFYVVCSNVETGKPEYIHCHNMTSEIDFLRASASLPVVSRIVKVGGKKLLDGGICDSIPVQAFINMGYDKNIVILTRPRGYHKRPSYLQWLTKLVYRKYPNFVEAVLKRHEMYNRELEEIEALERAGRILVLRPSKIINISKTEKNLQVVKDMYDLGREDAQNALEQIKLFLAQK